MIRINPLSTPKDHENPLEKEIHGGHIPNLCQMIVPRTFETHSFTFYGRKKRKTKETSTETTVALISFDSNRFLKERCILGIRHPPLQSYVTLSKFNFLVLLVPLLLTSEKKKIKTVAGNGWSILSDRNGSSHKEPQAISYIPIDRSMKRFHGNGAAAR